MGLSASQARLLSITRRINNNELRSELLANDKIRLANEEVEASNNYVSALSTQVLKYNVYNEAGYKEQVALTFNAINNYNTLQTQYAIMSATGQVYVNSTDAKNFENSNNLYEFLEKYKLVSEQDGAYVLADTTEAQWYTNLWYLMDAQSDVDLRYTNFGDDNMREMTDLKSIVKENGTGNYLVMDDVLASSSTWLQFALENGLATLTRVQTRTDGEGKNYWNSVEYTSVTDISAVDDDTAMDRAEIEYKQTLKTIEAEDKKLDTDMKKLDTEHSELESEYESVKNVISKNAERSFNAFS